MLLEVRKVERGGSGGSYGAGNILFIHFSAGHTLLHAHFTLI